MSFCAVKVSLKFCSVDYMVIIQKMTLEELLLINIESIKKIQFEASMIIHTISFDSISSVEGLEN